ncbi:MAG TPA: carboxypeptidase-like regulatory domain-containing protein [Blastocatellia bacterium]|nr:carboxypeptidase-like regulatory domain-containing protein [Blastocatellia bacterium]
MKRRLMSALFVLCSLAAVAAAGQKAGTLKGKIENDKGKPIAGAEVRVMSSRTRVVKDTTTDQAGNYSFELEPDDYTVSFDAEGFQGGTLVQMQQVEEGKATSVKTIRLQKAQRTSLIRGAVFDSTGSSLAGARIKLVRIPTDQEAKEKKKIESLSRDYVANSRGEFAFRLPSMRARYRLTAMLSGYKPETKVVDVNEGESAPVAFSLEQVKE